MPYIEQEKREEIDNGRMASTASELNYIYTRVTLDYLGTSPNYQRFNDVLGALEGCKQEIYRRLAAPYEDVKIRMNGDVF